MADQRDAELEQLKADVRYLKDRQAILDCINQYNRALDRLDVDLLASSFHEDAVNNTGPFVGGLDEFLKFAVELESSRVRTHHGVSAHTCDIDGDTAHAETYVYWFSTAGDGETIGAGGGRYIDKLERRNGEWRFTVRRLLLDWSFRVPLDPYLGKEWFGGSRDKNDPSYQRPLTLPPELEKILKDKQQPRSRVMTGKS